METVQQLIPLLITLSLGGMGAAIGMNAKLGELLSLFRQPTLLLRALLAVDVIVPIAAALLIWLFPLTPLVKVGIMVMAVSPAPAMLPRREAKAGAGATYRYALYTALILLAAVTVPVTVHILSRAYDVDVPLGPFAVLRRVTSEAIVPLGLGFLVRRLLPRLAERLGPVLENVATALLVIAALPLVVAVWPHMIALIGNGTVVAMAIVAAIALSAGHLLGGPDASRRGALAMAAATRHPGIALMVAGAAGEKQAIAAILEFVLVAAIVTILYQIWLKRAPPAAVPA
jgi:BASS family bile acid:Na+ symporter